MIQAISTANIQTNKQSTPIRPSFARNENSYDRPHHKRSAIGWSAEQFAKGAAISLVLDGLMNGYNKIAKNPSAMKGFSEFAKNAGFWGVCWIAMGLVFEGFNKLSNRNN